MYCGDNPVMYVDPSGQSFILFCVIFGSIVVSAIGATYAGVTAYNNGARGWELFGWILLGTIAGAIIGAALGWAIGSIITQLMTFAAQSWTFTFGNGAMLLGDVMAIGETTTIVITGAGILKTIGALGLIMMFSGWPGDDPTKSPGNGFDEWRGKGEVGSDKGAWYNSQTGESLHPDLNHPEPIGPHWDYIDQWKRIWRIFKDGIFRK